MTAAGGVTYGYDASGNQTSRGADTFTFDHEQRMTQSVVGGVTSSSVYYGNGVRRSHTVNGTATAYQYDVLASLPVVIQDGTFSYVYGLDLISMRDGSGNESYFSYDGLGSVTDITDGAGTVTDTFDYDVFGAVRTRTGTTPTVWKFTGEQADDGAGDSGYYFLRARYYDPATGRFVSKDKVEFTQRYVYSGNNPVLFVDPDGQCFGRVGELCSKAGSWIRDTGGAYIKNPVNQASLAQSATGVAGGAACAATVYACAPAMAAYAAATIWKIDSYQKQVQSGEISACEAQTAQRLSFLPLIEGMLAKAYVRVGGFCHDPAEATPREHAPTDGYLLSYPRASAGKE